MTIDNVETDITMQSFHAHQGSELQKQVHHVICLISQQKFISVGYHPSGEALVINEYTTSFENWDNQSLSKAIQNDTLCAKSENIKAIFFSSHKNILIPETLFNKNDAAVWLSSMFFISKNEAILDFKISSNKTRCCYAIPKQWLEAISSLGTDIQLLPVSACHFKDNMIDIIQCSIDYKYVTISIHKNSELVCYHTFEYETVEDIVYHLTNACHNKSIDIKDIMISIGTCSSELNNTQKILKEYFPNTVFKKAILSDVIAPHWSSTILLLQKLNACVL